jgi:hypothetical protein
MEAIVNSLSDAGHDIDMWLLHDFRIMPALLFLSPVFYNMAKKTQFSFKHPLLVALFSFFLFAAGYAPNNYASEGWRPGRLNDIIYYGFVLLVFLNCFYFIGYLQRLVSDGQITLGRELHARFTYMAIFFGVIFLFTSTLSLKKHTSVWAARDLNNGSAKQYSLEINEWYKLLHDDNIERVELPHLTYTPGLLVFETPLTTDKNNWNNQSIAQFYQKEYVVLIYPPD